MSYQTYTTEAIVCGSYLRNTSDKTFLLFARDAGMVYATARSVREEKSRQRYALQDFSRIRVTLLQGKGGWRIGSVTAIQNAYYMAASREARGGVCRAVQFLRKFISGESPHHALFDDAVVALDTLSSCTNSNATERVLTCFQLRALYTLGYIPRDAMYEEILTTPMWDTIEQVPKRAQDAIAVAVAASHL